MEYNSFSELNIARCEGPDGFDMRKQNPLFFTTAMAEELGEVCGVMKKLARGFNARERKKIIAKLQSSYVGNDVFEIPSEMALTQAWEKELMEKLEDEMADLFTYFDLFATKMHVDWKIATYRKFNKVSEEMNLPIKYLTTPKTSI